MSIEDIIQAWKAEEDEGKVDALLNPAGEELSEQELREVAGGMPCLPCYTCTFDISRCPDESY
jgi:hypothetical protein